MSSSYQRILKGVARPCAYQIPAPCADLHYFPDGVCPCCQSDVTGGASTAAALALRVKLRRRRQRRTGGASRASIEICAPRRRISPEYHRAKRELAYALNEKAARLHSTTPCSSYRTLGRRKCSSTDGERRTGSGHFSTTAVVFCDSGRALCVTKYIIKRAVRIARAPIAHVLLRGGIKRSRPAALQMPRAISCVGNQYRARLAPYAVKQATRGKTILSRMRDKRFLRLHFDDLAIRFRYLHGKNQGV